MPNELEDFQQQLLAEREQLTHLRDVGAAHQQIEGMVEKINEALEKINEGTFGVCEACGDPIQPERLEALPYATRCIECQRKDEEAQS